MSKFKVISRDAASVRYEGAPQYSGTYLGVDYIEFKNISSPTLIDWQIGDYVDYYRTGIRYKLYTLPMPKKVARTGSYGGAIEYSNVQFYAPTKDLEIAPFKDLVLNDNGIHFSTRPDTSTIEDVYGIARRIQACMDDLYPNRWRIEVYESDDEDLNALLSEAKEFSLSQSSCLDALTQIYDIWKGVGWTHVTENGQEVIIIGRANVRDNDNTTDLFTYGIGNGLTSIRKNAANEGEFATRLYVYGSERNLQPRYYNQFEIVDRESVDIRNLMIPRSEWGTTNGLPDPSKAYLQADDAIIEKYGLIPRTIYFDGSDGIEIYPSIQGLTMAQVREAMLQLGQSNEYLPEDTNTRIDVINSTFAEGDGSADDYNANPKFIVYLNSVGFNIAEQGKKTSEGVAKLSIKSGMCAGREFQVKKLVGYQEGDNGITWMAYEVERVWDESVAMAYPNSLYPLNKEDEFVLLDIPMPDYYITLNEQKLLEQGKKMLADYTRVSAFYEPEINAIRMKNFGGVITPGMYMKVKDDDIIDTEDHIDYVLIDSLSIDEITEIPTYKITLREEKRAARTYAVLEDMIEDAKEDADKAIKRERQYTDRRFKSAQETLSMLESAFGSFNKGITPATVQTMALLIGDESLQFKFTESRDSLEDVPCPLTWSSETKQILGVPAALVHMTLGIKDIQPIGFRKASDYASWEINSWHSPFLEDAAKSYYVYVKASQDDYIAEYFISEESMPMEDSGYYYFLVGVLNSEYEGSRDFVTLYGFTEVLPGKITTDVIKSSDGLTYFDLLNGIISGDIRFISSDGSTRGVNSLEQDVNNVSFLKDTFKKGETDISGGVVMTEMVAVENENEEVEAFLNGSTFAEDMDNGKLILAAGIENNNGDLELDAQEAKTRIYENGKLITKDADIEGKIVAKGGKIADFEINGSRIGVADNGTTTGMFLSNSYIGFRDNTTRELDSGTYKRFAAVGSNVNPSTAYECLARYESETNDPSQASYGTAYGVVSSVKGYQNSHAFHCPNGQFAGLRPKTKTITSSAPLSTFDHTIMVISQSPITITLPNSPEVGQEFDIFFAYNMDVNYPLKSNDVKIHWPSSEVWDVNETNITGKGMVKVICANDQNGNKKWWCYRFM